MLWYAEPRTGVSRFEPLPGEWFLLFTTRNATISMGYITQKVVSSIPAWSMIISLFHFGFICVSQCQRIKIKPKGMYIARARAQFKINIHLFISDALSVVQCSLGPAIWALFIDTVSVAGNERAGQLAAVQNFTINE